MEDKLMTEGPWWSSSDKQARVLADAIKIRDQDIRALKKLREMLVGPDFAGGLEDDDVKQPTNSTYGFYARMLPTCLGGQIVFQADTDYGAPEERMQLECEDAINEIFKRAGGREALELVFGDMICGYGGLFVKQGTKKAMRLKDSEREDLRYPVGRKSWASGAFTDAASHAKPWMDAPATMPEIHYLPPDSWGWDRRAFTFEQAEFYWYDTIHDINELIETARSYPEEGWNLKRLMGAKDKLMTEDLSLIGGKKSQQIAESERDREKIRVRTLMVKNATIDGQERPESHHAVRYTLWAPYSTPTAAEWIREPAYEFSPPFGQFILFRQHMIGEDSTPLNVLQANLTKLVATDKMHGVAYKKIRNQRRTYAIDASFSSQMQELEAAEDGDIVPVQGLEQAGGALQEIQRGGLDAPTVAAIQYLDAQLAKDLGLDDAARGATDASGDSTATEAALANAQSNARAAQFRRAFNEGVAQLGRTLAWFKLHDRRLVTGMGYEARAKEHQMMLLEQGASPEEARAGGLRAAAQPDAPRMLSQGGDFAERADLDFEALRFSIKPHLQAFMSPQMRRMESAQLRQELMNLLSVIPQMPFFDWIAELRQLEEDYGRRGLVDRLSPQFASLMAQARLEAGQTQTQVPQGAPQAPSEGGGAPRVTTEGAPVRGREARLGGFARPSEGLGGDA